MEKPGKMPEGRNLKMTQTQNYEGVISKNEMADNRAAKLAGWIDRGRQDAQKVFVGLAENRPRDFLVDSDSLDFDIRGRGIYVKTANNEFLLHRHAINQMVTKTNILTSGVANKMIDAATKGESWGKDLLLHNLHTIFSKSERKRVLMRAVPTTNGLEVRGFLSDRYKRMDCSPIFEQFAKAAQKFGAVPVSMGVKGGGANYHHDIKVGFSMFLPHVFRPVEALRDEVMIIGVTIQNSDFGGAALTVRQVVARIWCSNLMVTQDALRKMHLGSRLSQKNELVDGIHFSTEFAEDTYEADTKAMSLVTRDIVDNLLSESTVNAYTGRIRKAAEQEVDADKLINTLRTGGQLLKGEANRVKDLYKSADVELMPPGNTAWRASNAIALFANEMDGEGNSERAVELRQAAGVVLDDHVDAN